METKQQVMDWLETRWVAPSYGGWLMLGLAMFFFAAATNTMAGWLYVISGGMMAIALVAAWLPLRALQKLSVTRSPLYPISAGDTLRVEIQVHNPTPHDRGLLKLSDELPFVVGEPETTALESLPRQGHYVWSYTRVVTRRGVYRWQTIQMRTAFPLGLFWRRQVCQAPAIAVVYPQVLPLANCPLVDELGRDRHSQLQSLQQPQAATEGLTRALRPYRWGDPIRLVHWKSSARYGELRVRELEVITGGQSLIIALDSAIAWNADQFEDAVTAAASLYFYALRQNLQVSLWTAGAGLIQGQQAMLETLAAVHADEEAYHTLERIPDRPLVWLTTSGQRLDALPLGSRWVLWSSTPVAPTSPYPGLVIEAGDSIQAQLQRSPHRLVGRS